MNGPRNCRSCAEPLTAPVGSAHWICDDERCPLAYQPQGELGAERRAWIADSHEAVLGALGLTSTPADAPPGVAAIR